MRKGHHKKIVEVRTVVLEVHIVVREHYRLVWEEEMGRGDM